MILAAAAKRTTRRKFSRERRRPHRQKVRHADFTTTCAFRRIIRRGEPNSGQNRPRNFSAAIGDSRHCNFQTLRVAQSELKDARDCRLVPRAVFCAKV